MQARVVQVTQRVTRRAGPVHDDGTQDVLNRRLEATLTPLIDVDDVGESSKHAWQPGKALDAGTRPRLVERCLQRFDTGLERVRSVRRLARERLALELSCLRSLFGCREPLVLGP